MQGSKYFCKASKDKIEELNKAIEKFYKAEAFRSDMMLWLGMILRITAIVCLIYITYCLTYPLT